MVNNQPMSMVAVIPYTFAVSAFVGPLAASSEQVGDIEVRLRDRGFFKRHPSFGFRVACRVRKTAAGYVEVPDQKDYYIVGAALNSLSTRVRRELASVITRVTGNGVAFSKIPRLMSVPQF